MDKDQIMVSVCCLVYNHEKYLRQCLDGFVMQKTDFKYEVLIHDDASTDRSAAIIREYEERYPDIIKPIYQTENQYSKKVSILWVYQYPRAQGKYIALCEGDDYWTDEYKLQRQFEAMERDPRAVFCAHRVRVVTGKGRKTGRLLPPKSFHKSLMTSEEWTRSLLTVDHFFHTCSYFFSASVVKKWSRARPEFYVKYPSGDIALLMLFATEGGVIFLEETMSCYRLGSANGWVDNFWRDREKRDRVYAASLESLAAYDAFTGRKYAAEIDVAQRRVEMTMLQERGEYREMRAPRYAELYRKMTPYNRFLCYVKCRFPRLLYYYRMLKLKM